MQRGTEAVSVSHPSGVSVLQSTTWCPNPSPAWRRPMRSGGSGPMGRAAVTMPCTWTSPTGTTVWSRRCRASSKTKVSPGVPSSLPPHPSSTQHPLIWVPSPSLEPGTSSMRARRKGHRFVPGAYLAHHSYSLQGLHEMGIIILTWQMENLRLEWVANSRSLHSLGSSPPCNAAHLTGEETEARRG